MRLASFVISFCLHAGFVLLVLFWPSPPLYKPAPQAMTVSLVDGLPGGNRMPSPIIGLGAPARTQAPPEPPAPPPKEPPPPVSTGPPPEAAPVPIDITAPPKLEVPKPTPKPAPEPDAALLADKKKETPNKPETLEKEDKNPEPPKPEASKPAPSKTAPPKTDPVKEALNKLQADSKRVQGAVKVKPNAVAQALADARKQSGGGGGEGEGEGGGIGDVYGAQIVMAVQPNWHWPAQAKGNLSVFLYLKIDATGRVLDVRVEESSGNAVFDSSAVTAVRVTRVLPPPPSPAYREIILGFFPTQ